MQKSVIFLYLVLHLTITEAQWPNPLPSSPGPISLLQIYNWMQADGEVPISPSLLTLGKQQTQFAHKSSYSLRDWYGFHTTASSPCGASVVVIYTEGVNGAPESKTVTYGTTPFQGKCWITQNLGADKQAASGTDLTIASAGWYWQFNLMQGYRSDGTHLIATTQSVWDSHNNSLSDWLAPNDPCALLGSNWRMPTSAEYQNAVNEWALAGDGKAGYATIWGSVLKLHAAGYFIYNTDAIRNAGSYGYYWSSSLNAGGNFSDALTFNYGYSYVASNYVAYGMNVRCLK
jgi:hypothetical protein